MATETVMTISGDEGSLEFSNSDFKSVTTGLDARIDEHVVFFRFNPDTASEFAKFTYGNVGKTVEIRVCDELIISPRIMSAIYGGAGRLSNLNSQEKAEELAGILKSGKCK